MPIQLPDENPLVGQSRRQAHPSVAGYVYQIKQAVLRWIKLSPTEALFLEGVEDCDIVSVKDQSAQTCQFKVRADSVSLGRAEIIGTINNYWQSVTDNEDFRCELRYVTTSPVVVEKGKPFGKGVSGIGLWEAAKADSTAAKAIRNYLLKRREIAPRLSDFLRTASVRRIQEKFIRPISWVPGASNSEQVEDEIRRLLLHHGDARAFLAPACDAAYPALFTLACRACTKANRRRLTREDFLRAFDEAAMVHRDNAVLTRKLLMAEPFPRWDKVLSTDSGSQGFAAIDRGDFAERIRIASSPLLSWPATLPSGIWIPRPEFEQLAESIGTRQSSAVLLLGEPGSGKSALLARLAAHCATLPDTLILAIKADALPQSIMSPDDILPGWEGRGLVRWLSAVARHQRVVVLIDQLDAVAEIMDRRTARLNVLLSLAAGLAKLPGIHLVASCRLFEFKHDTRLQGLGAENQVSLKPLEGARVDEALLAAGHNPALLTNDCRGLLSNPWNLSVYLRHAKPGEEIASLGVILNRIWSERVSGPKAPNGTITFLREVAIKVRDEEQLWLPIAIADRNPAGYRHLLSEQILTESTDGLTFGFRHQSLFDFALLREFQSAAVSLSDFVWTRQDGLFVRPTLLAALRYMRNSATRDYLKELQSLLMPPRGRKTRFHIRELLIGFLGSLVQPSPGEAALLLPLLRSRRDGPRVLRACTGSPGWFSRLATNSDFVRWLDAPPARASMALGCITAGLAVAEPTAARLMARYWLPRANCHGLILRALWNVPKMGDSSINILFALAGKVPPDRLGVVIREVEKSSSSAAAKMLGNSLACHTRRLMRGHRRPSRNRLSALGDLLEKDVWGHCPLDHIAAKVPKEFLDAIWPTVADLLPFFVRHRTPGGTDRFPDGKPTLTYPQQYGQSDGLLRPLMIASRTLAAKDPAAFRRFAALASLTDQMFAQRLVANGFISGMAALGSDACTWLLADSRRLHLRNYWQADETTELMRAIAPGLDSHQIAALVKSVISYSESTQNLTGETAERIRAHANYLTKKRRAQLLGALPRERLPAKTEEYLHGLETELGPHGMNPPQSRGGWVGPPMNKEEVALASDDQLLGLIATLPDSTQWEHPGRDIFTDPFEKSGGAIQQSRVICEMAKADPARAVRLAGKLQPATNELYAGELLVGLAGSSMPAGEVLPVFLDFHSRGFSSLDFRVRSADALQELAKRGAGLPDEAVNLLIDLISALPVSAEKEDPPDTDDELTRTILFGFSSWGHFESSSRVMSAVTSGVLNRNDPARFRRMLDILRILAATDHSALFWAQALLECHSVWAALPAEGTKFLDEIVRCCPEILHLTPGRHGVAHAIPFLKPDSVARSWVKQSQKRGSASDAQFAGELAFLTYAFHQTRPNARMLKVPRYGNQNSYRRGLTLAAVHFFRCDETKDATRRLVGNSLGCRNKGVRQAALGFVRTLNFQALDDQERSLVRRFLAIEPDGPLGWTSELVERLAGACDAEPALASFACKRLLDTADKGIGNFQNGLSMSQGHLINMALTLHRLKPYRRLGLVLFERMLRLNLRELHDALKHLDQREASAPAI